MNSFTWSSGAAPAAPQAQQSLQQGQQQQQQGPTTEVTIVSQTEVINADGSFNYSYETSNGIRVDQGGYVKKAAESRSLDPNSADGEESGDVQVIQGSFSYTAPDGQQIQLNYIADENGFQPQGAHLPTVPPSAAGANLQGQQQGEESNQRSNSQSSYQQQKQQSSQAQEQQS